MITSVKYIRDERGHSFIVSEIFSAFNIATRTRITETIHKIIPLEKTAVPSPERPIYFPLGKETKTHEKKRKRG